ncbi:MAG: GTP-binding protein, partial [Bacteroidales bacterium]|nr:GTP-binding protein [Bacteroidales bacterium]
STLDEVREADLLIHVVDISHPGFEQQIEVVNNTLSEIDAGDKPMIMLFNKIDAYTYVEKEEDDLTPKTKENRTLEELQQTYMSQSNRITCFVSAKNKENIDNLRQTIYDNVKTIHAIRYPYNNFLY